MNEYEKFFHWMEGWVEATENLSVMDRSVLENRMAKAMIKSGWMPDARENPEKTQKTVFPTHPDIAAVVAGNLPDIDVNKLETMPDDLKVMGEEYDQNTSGNKLFGIAKEINTDPKERTVVNQINPDDLEFNDDKGLTES